ncbi:MAG: amidase [Methyloceanibacter sp.]|uniref:amidase n=1 Tax=Methyloceanibacter sp. TaxID=1965321 RepID=UPI003D9BEB98
MPLFPQDDAVGALVPHTLKAPLTGLGSGPLTGRTFMVKDLFAIAGQRVGNGNPAFYAHAEPATETAAVIQRLLDAGGTCTGITLCDEFFYSVLGTNVHYGALVNPRAPGRVTGGSSCGSAAAVAAGMCDFALGSDTGGSIRVPASFCGLYGLRPTFGRIDMAGATEMAPSFDTVGVFARDAALFRDAGHMLLAGDRVAAPIERIVLAEDIFAYTDPRTVAALRQTLLRLKDSLPRQEPQDIAGGDIAAWRDAFRIIQGFEIQSTLLPFIASHDDVELGPGIKERFALAASITASEADAARAMREDAAIRLHAIAKPGTLIVLPTTPTLPPERGIKDGDAVAQFRTLTLQSTCLAGLAGLPQISLPAAETDNIPVGLSLIGWPGADETLLDIAVKLEPLLRKTL